MPAGRGMVEGTLLPDGTVIWLNGGNLGAQGFLDFIIQLRFSSWTERLW